MRAALVLVSVDHLDIVNTAFGHKVGTAVLSSARQELIRVVRATDSVWRFAGSKFAVIMRDVVADDVRAASRRFRDAMSSRVYPSDAGPVSVTVSVGAVIVPDDAETADEAHVNALVAVEEARRDRWRGVALFRPDPLRDRRRADDAHTAQNVIAAIAQSRMRLAFQPVSDAQTGEIAFHEALIRIVDTDGHLLEASDFIVAAERLGLIRLVDHEALTLALAAIEAHDVDLSLNISVDTCHDPAWLAKLTMVLEAKPHLARRLIVEITESQAAIHLEDIRMLVEALKALGCRVAIDDFGAGYTSFRSLKALPVDIIKIDGAFAADIMSNMQDRVFIKSLVDIANAIGAKTVVEWVDSAESGAMLADWGVDYLQGYAVGRPSLELASGPVAGNTRKQARG